MEAWHKGASSSGVHVFHLLTFPRTITLFNNGQCATELLQFSSALVSIIGLNAEQ